MTSSEENGDLPGVTPIGLLAAWANEQDSWVRAVVAEICASRRDPSDIIIQEAYRLFKAEKALSLEAFEAVDDLDTDGQSTASDDRLSLLRVSEVAGVNALAKDQTVELNAKLTILFGENASGKTGYVRILQRLAAVRGAKAILSNIHSASGSGSPCATILYQLGKDEKTLKWKDEEGVRPFTRIAIFDARAVGLHVDEDLTYLYTPGDLALFAIAHRSIERVRDLLGAEVETRKRKDNPFLKNYERGTDAYSLVETLGAASDVEDMNRLAVKKVAVEERLSGLERQIEALNPTNVQSRTTAASARIELLEGAAAIFSAMQKFETNDYERALVRVVTARTAHASMGEESFKKQGVKHSDTREWQELLLAAEKLTSTALHDEYPAAGDQCLYCNQELAADAVALIQSFRGFVNGEAGREVADAERALVILVETLESLSPAPLIERIDRRIADAPDPDSERLLRMISDALRECAAAVSVVQNREQPLVLTELKSALATLQLSIVEQVSQARNVLISSQKEEATRLAEREAKANELRGVTGQVRLDADLPELRSYVEQAKWCTKADTLLTRVSGTLRSLTAVSKRASEDVLNRDFEVKFRTECKALRAPSVTLDFPGKKGKTTRRKVIADSYRVSQILSEGEQKVIALADFFAEAALRPESAPIVLDDPVTSLDYRRIHEVVRRLVELSGARQVIVFTHNVWFASELLQEAKKDCFFYNVREDGAVKGVVSHDQGPRTDTVKSLKARINVVIQDAQKLDGVTRQAIVDQGYDFVRSWCEVVVEQVLLEGVVRRYEPNIRLTVLEKIDADRLGSASKVIVPIFEKACRFINAHSQPLEQLNVRPTLKELEEDWRLLQLCLK